MPKTSADGVYPAGQSVAPRKSDIVYHHVKRRIILGEYTVMRALTEQRLATELGCSQSTVREALMRLEQEGFVTRRGYQGTMVSLTSLAEAAQMIRIRLLIERSAARELAQSIFASDRTEILGITERMDKARSDNNYYACSELDRQFHTGLLKAASMEALVPIALRCSHYIHRFTLSHASRGTQQSIKADLGRIHRKLLDDIADGTPDQAEQAVIGHIQQVLQYGAPSLLHAVVDGTEASISSPSQPLNTT